MKNKLFTLAAALTLVAVLGSIYVAPALAAVIKAALVKNVDEKGRTPYQRYTGDSDVSSLTCSQTGFTAPVDRRLVIEHVSLFAAVSAGSVVTSLNLNFPSSNSAPLVFTEVAPRSYVANTDVLIYLEPGQSATVKWQSNVPSGIFLCSGTVSGYLVDLTI